MNQDHLNVTQYTPDSIERARLDFFWRTQPAKYCARYSSKLNLSAASMRA
jgi:hypothetical protein